MTSPGDTVSRKMLTPQVPVLPSFKSQATKQFVDGARQSQLAAESLTELAGQMQALTARFQSASAA